MEPGPLPPCAHTTHHLAPYPHPAAEEQEGVTASPEEVPAGPSSGDPPHLPVPLGPTLGAQVRSGSGTPRFVAQPSPDDLSSDPPSWLLK